jgi:hypothetical protein
MTESTDGSMADPPYDEALDAIMVARGWDSNRQNRPDDYTGDHWEWHHNWPFPGPTTRVTHCGTYLLVALPDLRGDFRVSRRQLEQVLERLEAGS